MDNKWINKNNKIFNMIGSFVMIVEKHLKKNNKIINVLNAKIICFAKIAMILLFINIHFINLLYLLDLALLN